MQNHIVLFSKLSPNPVSPKHVFFFTKMILLIFNDGFFDEKLYRQFSKNKKTGFEKKNHDLYIQYWLFDLMNKL